MAGAALRHSLRQQAREHDRRAQVDVERAVDLLDAEVVDHAARRQACVRDEDLDVPDLLGEARDGIAVREVDGERTPAELLRERLEHVARRPVSTSWAPRAASVRAIAWPMPPLAPVRRTVPLISVMPEACHRQRAHDAPRAARLRRRTARSSR